MQHWHMSNFLLIPAGDNILGVDSIPISRMTILLGANGSGKTTALNEINACLNASANVASVGRLEIDAHILDDDAFERIIFHFLSDGTEFDSEEQYIAEFLNDYDGGEQLIAIPVNDYYANGKGSIRQRVTDLLAHSQQSGAEKIRLKLASEIVAGMRIAFCGNRIGLAVDIADTEHTLDDIQLLVTQGFDLSAGDNLAVCLSEILRSDDGEAWLHEPSQQAYENVMVLDPLAIPYPMQLDFTIESLTKELDLGITAIAYRILHGGKVKPNLRADRLTESEWAGDDDEYAQFRSWLLTEDTGFAIKIDKASGLRLNPLVQKTIDMINDRAEFFAPTFLKEEGAIHVELTPVTGWPAGEPRVRFFMSNSRGKLALERCGCGHARYATLTIRLAMFAALYAERVPIFPTDATPEEIAAIRESLIETSAYIEPVKTFEEAEEVKSTLYRRFDSVSGTGLTPDDPIISKSVQDKLIAPLISDGGEDNVSRLLPDYSMQRMPIILLIDEPEAHLHPLAVRSVKSWLLRIQSLFLATVVATHNPVLADISSLDSSTIVLEKTEGASNALVTGMRSLEVLAVLGNQIGMTKGDLLQMARYFLFVEGPHDEILLHEFFGEILDDAGIKVFPLHGLERAATSLVDSEFVAAIGKPMGVMADKIGGEGPSHERKLIDRLIREVSAINRKVDILPLSKPDILDYLPSEIVAQVANKGYVNWEVSRSEYAKYEDSQPKNKKSFKDWARGAFDMDLERETIRRMAAETRKRNLIDPEIIELISKLIASVGGQYLDTEA
jgi:energy-coupling factor transporter ATP-binding protein EcfA2